MEGRTCDGRTRGCGRSGAVRASVRLEIGEPSGSEWLRVDRILEPDGPELTELLKRDNDASGHVTPMRTRSA